MVPWKWRVMEAELVSAKLCEAKPGYADKQAEGEGGRVPQMEALGQGGEVKRTGSRAATVRASVPSFVFSPSYVKSIKLFRHRQSIIPYRKFD